MSGSVTANRTRLLETFVELCSIPSPTYSEHRVAARIREMAAERGATIRVSGMEEPEDTPNLSGQTAAGRGADPLSDASAPPEQGNMILVSADGPHEAIFLSAHMDTVPVPHGIDRIVVLREDGRITSNGTTVLGGDDKAGVALALEMLALCAEHPGHHRSLEVVILVQEEIGCVGSRNFDAASLYARNGFNLDGETPPYTAITRAPRKYFYTCTIHGKSAHGALNPDDGINAVIAAADLVGRLPQGTLDESSTGNVGAFHGGKQTNVVPDCVTIDGELRSFSPATVDAYRSVVEEACHTVEQSHGVTIDLEWRLAYNEYTVAPEEKPVAWFADACRRRGAEPKLLSSRGGTDSNNLNAQGLSNIVFGVGMHNIHSPNEYVVEEELYTAADLLAAIVFPPEE